MTATQVRAASRIGQADGETPAVRIGGSRRHRLGLRIWTVLHAQALLDGRTGDPYEVTLVEDDWRRLAARRAR